MLPSACLGGFRVAFFSQKDDQRVIVAANDVHFVERILLVCRMRTYMMFLKYIPIVRTL